MNTPTNNPDLMRAALQETVAVLEMSDAFPGLLKMVKRALAAPAQAAPAEQPIGSNNGWLEAALAPANAAEVRQAFDSYCEQVQHALPSAAPHDDDRYVLTAYDIVEALKNWNAT